MYFLIFSAVLLVIVLAFLLPPLWKQSYADERDHKRRQANLNVFQGHLLELEAERREGLLADSDFELAKGELQRRLLEEVTPPDLASSVKAAQSSRKVALGLLVLLPLLAAAGYALLGSPQALNPMATVQPDKMSPEQIKAMVARLEARLKDNPDDTAGWLMLARSYKSFGRTAEAVVAYGKVEAVLADDADFLTDYADLLAMQAGGSLDGKPLALINKALHVDPNHVIALWLAGTAAFNQRDFSGAVFLWERAAKILPPEGEDAQMLNDGIVEAKRRIALKAKPGQAVSGKVELAAKLKESVSPSDTVFVFARPTDGSRMPLAVAKIRVADLPYAFLLDDSLAMIDDKRISAQSQVIVEARVSHSGNVMPQNGDLQSKAVTVRVGEKNLRLVVDQIIQRP